MVELLKSGRINNRLRGCAEGIGGAGSYLDVFTSPMCTQLQIRYEKPTEQERTALKNIMKKSSAYKDFSPGRMKRG